MATTKLCGLLGAQIAHSISPNLHNTWAQQHDTALQYVSLQLNPEEDCVKLVSELTKLENFFGINVTTPFKSTIVNLEIWPREVNIQQSNRVQKISAANTLFKLQPFHFSNAFASFITPDKKTMRDLTNRKSIWMLHNTDVDGIIETFRSLELLPEHNCGLVILGAGGAARAAALAAAEYFKEAEALLMSRNWQEDKNSLAALLPKQLAPTHLPLCSNLTKQLSQSISAFARNHEKILIINSLPLGRDNSVDPQNPFAQLLLNFFSQSLKENICYFDMQYQSNHGCQVAAQLGIPHQTGLLMLKEQARRSFHCWTGILPTLS